jgi:DNA-binding PadR family transcriptional regulator
MSKPISSKPNRKAKKSYTLSPESVEFLEALRKKQRSGSISSILEEILQAVRREHQRAKMEQAVADYYGSLSTKETTEQTAWGEFAFRQFPNQERS